MGTKQNRTTSPAVARQASAALRNPKTPANLKSIAASDLAQAAKRKGK
jgi:hypothetical protein